VIFLSWRLRKLLDRRVDNPHSVDQRRVAAGAINPIAGATQHLDCGMELFAFGTASSSLQCGDRRQRHLLVLAGHLPFQSRSLSSFIEDITTYNWNHCWLLWAPFKQRFACAGKFIT
jgi:hypothetical protein